MGAAQLGALAASIAVPIALALLARLLPASTTDSAGPTLEELRPKYKKWDEGLTVLFLVLCAPITLALARGLQWLSARHAELLPPAEIILTAMPAYWYLPALFLSLLCALQIVTWMSILLLKDRYKELERYATLKSGTNLAKATRLVVVAIALPSAVAIFLGLNWYVLVTEDELVVNRLLSVSEDRYPIKRIESIRTAPRLIAPNGNVVHRREYVVRFPNGGFWSTDWSPANLDDEAKRMIIGSLSRKSGVPIREVDVFKRGEF